MPSNLDNYKNNKKQRLKQNLYKEGYVASETPRAVTEQTGDIIISNPIIVERVINVSGVLTLQNLTPVDTVVDGDVLTLDVINLAPLLGSVLILYLNGAAISPADGPGNYLDTVFYITSSDDSIVRAFGTAEVGDRLHWNGSIAGFEISTDDEIFITYDI